MITPINKVPSGTARALSAGIVTATLAIMGGLLVAALSFSVLAEVAVTSTETAAPVASYRRLLPLEGGSNFRDLGGYATEDGKEVKRGLLFRSGVMTSLSERDEHYLDSFGFKTVVDLRSTEELELYPNNWVKGSDINYVTTPYSIVTLMAGSARSEGQHPSMGEVYQKINKLIEPQLKSYFDELVKGQAPLVVNCSAGQDRTGVASALLLSALGVPRHVVVEDYLLSSDLRRPAVERGNVDMKVAAETNAFARMMLSYQDRQQDLLLAPPLVDNQGVPYIEHTLAHIDKQYGSVAGYLDQVLEVTPEEQAMLRQRYLQ